MRNYFKEVRAEMRHVSWPTRQQTILYTTVVVAVSVGVAIYLGVWDYLFSAILKRIL